MNFNHLLAILTATAIAVEPVASGASALKWSGERPVAGMTSKDTGRMQGRQAMALRYNPRDEPSSPTVLAARRKKSKRPRPSAMSKKERIAKLPVGSRASSGVRIRQQDGAMAASLRKSKGLSRRAARKEARTLRRKQNKRVEDAFKHF
jgi:hypothetical protein